MILLNLTRCRRLPLSPWRTTIRHASYTETVQSIWTSISQSAPVACVQNGLITAHDITGLPWWATIVLSTVFLRATITLPLTVYQYKIMGRLEKISAEMPGIVNELKKETAVAYRKFKLTEDQAKALFVQSTKKQWDKLVIRENCHPAKTAITIWVQMPLWIVQSVAIRNLVSLLPDPGRLEAQVAFSEMTVGGFGWIPNLIEVDHSWILPVTMGIVNLLVIEIQSSMRRGKEGKFSKYVTNAFRVLTVIMVPVAASVPSCLALYWVTSSTFGLAQNLAFLTPKARKLLGVPNLAHFPKEKPVDFLVEKLLRRKSRE